MTTKQLAEKAQILRDAYHSTFLVKHTKAWEEFCFQYSAEIVEALKKASEG